MKINYQKKLNKIIENIIENETVPKLLLHSCCAPCSSYVLEYLSEYFEIVIFFYNPNITEQKEYEKRLVEQKEYITKINSKHSISLIEGNYETNDFFDVAKKLKETGEGGARCFECYKLRMNEAAMKAKQMNLNYFCTALSISPMKNVDKINEIGLLLENIHGVKYLENDFKKKNGYKRSIELSKENKLYRQDYCGCIYSKLERENKDFQIKTLETEENKLLGEN